MNMNTNGAAPMLDLQDVAMHFKSRGRGFRTATVRALDGVSLTLIAVRRSPSSASPVRQDDVGTSLVALA